MPRLLVLSAWEPELAPLRRRAAARRGRARDGVDIDIVCLPVGIGAVDAGINSARAIAEQEPALVIFVGTAGAYVLAAASRARSRSRADAAPAIGAAVVAESLTLISTAKLRGDGYLPDPMVVAGAPIAALAAELRIGAGVDGDDGGPGIAGASVACPLAITRTRALGAAIARATGAGVENLEAFSVARAAGLAGVPFGAVLGIANRVGPRAHAEWLRHHAAASQAACDVVWDWLRR